MYDPIPSLTQVNYSLGAGYFTNVNSFYTFLITPWDRVLLEKLPGSQLVKKFPVFYGTWKFITPFTNACHLSLSWARSIQSIPPHPTAWRSILILSFQLHLGTELYVQTIFIRRDKYELLKALIYIQWHVHWSLPTESSIVSHCCCCCCKFLLTRMVTLTRHNTNISAKTGNRNCPPNHTLNSTPTSTPSTQTHTHTNTQTHTQRDEETSFLHFCTLCYSD